VGWWSVINKDCGKLEWWRDKWIEERDVFIVSFRLLIIIGVIIGFIIDSFDMWCCWVWFCWVLEITVVLETLVRLVAVIIDF
jgi:hypothetical protein